MISKIRFTRICLISFLCFISSSQASSQELFPIKLSDSLWHNQQRELRYKPDGEDFVITNGDRLFTRALYGTHTAFRVETGDRPEFALYMPGMGGNFKFGLQVGDSTKCLTAADSITARYRAGSMIYTIQDALLGKGKMTIHILAMADAEGFIIKTNFHDIKKGVQLVWAFGGASGKKFSRDGDMGPDPASNFFLKPENCADNRYTINKATFILRYGAGLQVAQDGRYFVEDLNQQSQTGKEQSLTGIFPTESILKISDATKQSSPKEFITSSADKAPALAGSLPVSHDVNYYFAIHNPASGPAFAYDTIASVFQQAEEARRQIADRIKIKTPDPFINTIGGTLAIASDATWEAPSYLHGSIGWRMRLNGWRGAYTADALGWHDRARMHLESYLQSQVITLENGPVVADTATHLSRSWEKLGVGMFTNGYISRDPGGKNLRAHHYDMNLVFFDIILRHYAWTGDLDFVKKTWPALKRQLEWETRNFDADGDGLYDAYAAIWASDALQYSGGGVAHSSAYNYFANKKAAEIATILGENPSLYQKQADKILHAMNNKLWLKDKGTFAEYKDLLGNQLLHKSPALWTIYHSMDSETMDPFQAYQSMRNIDKEIPHIPVRARGLEDNGYYNLSTTNWMPYTWSLNNAALAESMHTVLANWQAGRTDEAFKLFKSEIISSMYLGGSPGNIVQISYYDAIRGEAYRDFGDPVGMFSRALVEGLFGIVPDALHDQLRIRPGMPANWTFASFSTPDIAFDFKRKGKTDTYIITQKFTKKRNLKFQIIAQGQVQRIIVNGKKAAWKNLPTSVGKPVIEINSPAASGYLISITWSGAKPVLPSVEKTYASGSKFFERIKGAKVIKVNDPQEALKHLKIDVQGISGELQTGNGNYTVFAQLQQGDLVWWMPICFTIVPPVTLLSANNTEKSSNRFRLMNNTSKPLMVSVQVNRFVKRLSISSQKASDEVVVPYDDLVTGTNAVNITMNDKTTIGASLIDWTAITQGETEMVDLSAAFNDKVTQIFKNKYLTPRPTVTTLQLPWQGTGDWPHPLETHNINDSGLRKLAGKKNTIILPQGIQFATPGASNKNNIAFTSQWDNYPRQVSIPLSGNASHAWLLMAGFTNPMQSQLDNGSITVEYTDGTKDSIALRNPETWWPIEEDYYTDGFAFSLKQPRPVRIHLKTGAIVSGEESKSTHNGKELDGGAATVLDLPLNASKTLKRLVVRTMANDVVIGLMALTLLRK